MSRKSKNNSENGQAVVTPSVPARSATLAARGVTTASQFSQVMSALMSDLLEGRVAPSVGNAACNAGGKMLKSVEMQFKYGVAGKDQKKQLILVASDEE